MIFAITGIGPQHSSIDSSQSSPRVHATTATTMSNTQQSLLLADHDSGKIDSFRTFQGIPSSEQVNASRGKDKSCVRSSVVPQCKRNATKCGSTWGPSPGGPRRVIFPKIQNAKERGETHAIGESSSECIPALPSIATRSSMQCMPEFPLMEARSNSSSIQNHSRDFDPSTLFEKSSNPKYTSFSHGTERFSDATPPLKSRAICHLPCHEPPMLTIDNPLASISETGKQDIALRKLHAKPQHRRRHSAEIPSSSDLSMNSGLSYQRNPSPRKMLIPLLPSKVCTSTTNLQAPSNLPGRSMNSSSHLPATPPTVSRSIIMTTRLLSPHFSAQYAVKPKPLYVYQEEQKQLKAKNLGSLPEQEKSDIEPSVDKPKSILRKTSRLLKKDSNTSEELSSSTEATEPTATSSSSQVGDATNTMIVKVTKIASIDSDITSVASSDCSILSDKSSQSSKTERRTSFDPRVWVREFKRSQEEREAIWYKPEEMNQFKKEALSRILHYHQHHSMKLVPTGTGRAMLHRQQTQITGDLAVAASKALFSHQALRMDYVEEFPCCVDSTEEKQTTIDIQKAPEPLSTCSNIRSNDGNLPPPSILHSEDIRRHKAAVAEREVRNILIVDPIDICSNLFSKSLRRIFPGARITISKNKVDAMSALQNLSSSSKGGEKVFDLVLVEERLPVPKANQTQEDRASSGSTILRHLAAENQNRLNSNETDACNTCGDTTVRRNNNLNLLIGCSAFLSEDRGLLIDSGADIVWGKPPPRANLNLRDQILYKLLYKRGNRNLANQLFSSTTTKSKSDTEN